MFKAARWRSDKTKTRAVFKLQFVATQVPQPEWDTLVVSLLPQDGGKPTSKSDEAVVQDGKCQWDNPVHEVVKFIRDSKSGKLSEKAYNLLVSSGSSKGAVLGEAAIDFTAYAESVVPSSTILHLKSSKCKTFLHVTIQRVQSAADGRVIENEDVTAQRHNQILNSRQPSNGYTNSNREESGMIQNGQHKYLRDGNADADKNTNADEVESEANSALSYCRKMFQTAEYKAIHRESSLDSESEQNTPREKGSKSRVSRHDIVLLSCLSGNATPNTPKEHHRSNTECSVSSGPDASSDDSTNGSECMVLKDKSDDADVSTEKLKNELILITRKAEISEIELQTLRKQIVKECKKSHDLFKEVSSLKEERDAYKRDCENLRASKYKENNLKIANRDPYFSLELIKEELDHEKELNKNLRLQLQKTQDSNSKLILAVRDLEEFLEQKSNDKASTAGATSDITQSTANREEFQSISKHDIEEDEDQQALEELVRRHAELKAEEPLERVVSSLITEIEAVRKEREELEMHMEQLALDYEILKQENHDLSSKLQRIELQEQLKMNYECSSSSVIIDDLEESIQFLQKEIETQAASFISDIEQISQLKVEQEQRAIRAEEALRKTKWNNANIAQKLQKEFMTLSVQTCTTYEENKKLALIAQADACELHAREMHLESQLENSSEELERVKDLYRLNFKKAMYQLDLKDRKINSMTFEMQSMMGLVEQKDEMLAEIEDSMRSLREETQLLLKERSKESHPLEELCKIKHFGNERKGKVFILRSEMENIKRQYNDLKKILIEDKLESENLRNNVFHLRNAVQEKEDTVAMIEKKLKGFAISDGKGRASRLRNRNISFKRYKSMSSSRKKIKLLQNEIKLKADEVVKFKQPFPHNEEELSSTTCELKKESSEKEAKRILPYQKLEDVQKITEMVQYEETNNQRKFEQYSKALNKEEKYRLSPGFDLEKEKDTAFITGNQNDISSFLSQMRLLMQSNKQMEIELKELHGRYSEISLKFAEVEGERQQLVMTVRSLKSTMKC